MQLRERPRHTRDGDSKGAEGTGKKPAGRALAIGRKKALAIILGPGPASYRAQLSAALALQLLSRALAFSVYVREPDNDREEKPPAGVLCAHYFRARSTRCLEACGPRPGGGARKRKRGRVHYLARRFRPRRRTYSRQRSFALAPAILARSLWRIC